MKKYLVILFVLLLIPCVVSAQAWRDGRWMNNTIDSDAYIDGSIDDEHLSATAVDGGNSLEATQIVGWFPVTFDSTSDGSAVGSGAWTLDASNPPSAGYWGTWPVLGFDADGSGDTDEAAYLEFVLPYDYDEGGLEFYLYWFITDKDAAATDSVEWNLSVSSFGNADTLVHTDSTLTAVFATCSSADSSLYITNIDPETDSDNDDLIYTYGDIVRVKILVDENGVGATNDLDSGERAYLRGVLVTAEKRDD